jgi:hypothetical protein
LRAREIPNTRAGGRTTVPTLNTRRNSSTHFLQRASEPPASAEIARTVRLPLSSASPTVFASMAREEDELYNA